ncbi:hypothetical protein T492DRAFT_1036044 [Pavlovales sp. CCMP2436]|nr:hypothetical protein T492DRAFT_1036044 [Pavlovales sp. CCMP2436]
MLVFLVLAFVVAAQRTVSRVSLDYISRTLLARGLLLVKRARVPVRWRRVHAADTVAGRACPDGRAGSACPDGRMVRSLLARVIILAKRARTRRRRAIHDAERSSLFALSPELVQQVKAYYCALRGNGWEFCDGSWGAG